MRRAWKLAILTLGVVPIPLVGCDKGPGRACVTVVVGDAVNSCRLYGEKAEMPTKSGSEVCGGTAKRRKACPDGAKKICYDKSLDMKTYYYETYVEYQGVPDCAKRNSVEVKE